MNFDWLSYLEQYEGVDVSPVRNIIETESKLIKSVINEAFGTHPFVSKDEAKLIIEDFEKKSPEGIPDGFITEYKSKIVSAIDSLTEGEIKIIINNDVNKGSSKTVDVVSDMDEGKKPTGKRGRPKKIVQEEAPIDESADDIVKGAYVEIVGKWYVVDSVNGDDIFVSDANPSDDEHGAVYHKFSTQQVEEISSEMPLADAPSDVNSGEMTISIITPDDFDNEVSDDNGEDDTAEFVTDLDWDAIEQGYGDELKDDEVDGDEEEIEVIDEPEDEEEEEEKKEVIVDAVDVSEVDSVSDDDLVMYTDKNGDVIQGKVVHVTKNTKGDKVVAINSFANTVPISAIKSIVKKAVDEAVEDYKEPFEPKDDTSDANGKSNLFNKNNEASIESEKVGRKFRGRKVSNGVTFQGDIEEELDPETMEALKGIKASDPKAKEFFDKMNNRTRTGKKSTKSEIDAELKAAVK